MVQFSVAAGRRPLQVALTRGHLCCMKCVQINDDDKDDDNYTVNALNAIEK